MRPISRTALGAAATAAVLAVTAVGPSTAQPIDGASGAGKRPLVGSEEAGKQSTAPVTVTLVTGDRILVSTDSAGRTAATAMPREDGSQPLVQTRQSGKDLYVYPQGAVKALAAGKVDHELFNVTGLVRQGYDDAHTKKLPLIAVYDGSVNVARTAPPAPAAPTAPWSSTPSAASPSPPTRRRPPRSGPTSPVRTPGRARCPAG